MKRFASFAVLAASVRACLIETFCYPVQVSTVPEIESAIRELPLEDASAIAAWLQHYLDQGANRRPGKDLEKDRLDHEKLANRERTLPSQLLPRGAYAVRGFARRHRPQPRSTAEWMKELREGET